MGRLRITDESVANIKVATMAKIAPVKGGYVVTMENDYGSETLKNANGDAIYKTKSAGKKVVHRHNLKVKFVETETPASPSMRPPERLGDENHDRSGPSR